MLVGDLAGGQSIDFGRRKSFLPEDWRYAPNWEAGINRLHQRASHPMSKCVRLLLLPSALAVFLVTAAWAQTETVEDGTQAAQRHDFAAAAQIWFPLAQKGNAEAQCDIGLLFLDGLGTTQNYEVAMKWFKQSADQGYSKAQFLLGTIYEQGRGVAQDKKEAARWYRTAADQGFALAQYSLGNLYQSGSGVVQDNNEAFKLYQKAALQGLPQAQYNLGVMYAKGAGIAQDFLRAHMWFNLSAAQGFPDAPNARSLAESKMTPAQIVQAQDMASRCQTSHYKDCN